MPHAAHVVAQHAWATPCADLSFDLSKGYTANWDYRKMLGHIYPALVEAKLALPPSESDVYQFGVFRAQSLIQLAKMDTAWHNDTRFFGFDSFTGLPEDVGDVSPWSEGTKGARGFTFKSNNGHVAAHSVHTNIVTKALGPTRAAAVHLIPGYYNVSLTPKLVASHKLRPAACASAQHSNAAAQQAK